uniref:Uncharacterized protein n=1 Tax=Trypanosoma vivax (strain Y486) TaxID=1055687 RepID=G0U2N3_TRYVY|nr:hypothetical protein TVY486_0903570 [Trypanosoma vivax Y486]
MGRGVKYWGNIWPFRSSAHRRHRCSTTPSLLLPLGKDVYCFPNGPSFTHRLQWLCAACEIIYSVFIFLFIALLLSSLCTPTVANRLPSLSAFHIISLSESTPLHSKGTPSPSLNSYTKL